MNLTFSRKIKQEARFRLKYKWSIALGICLLFGLIALMAVFFQNFFWRMAAFVPHNEKLVSWLAYILFGGAAILFFLFVRPLWLGVVAWCAAVAEGLFPAAGLIFLYFRRNHYHEVLRYSLRRLSKLAIWALLSFAGTALAVSVAWSIFEPAWIFGQLASEKEVEMPTSAVIIGAVGILLGLIAYLALTMRYFLADYLFVLEEETAYPMEKSAYWMQRYTHKMWRLLLSFGGWVLLCIFIFPALFVVPYLAVSVAVTQKWMVFDSKERERKLTDENK